MEKKVIFVVGHPRSGTTLLQALLLNIPNSISMPESNIFNLISHRLYRRGVTRFPTPTSYPKLITPTAAVRIIDALERRARISISAAMRKSISEQASQQQLTPKSLFETFVRDRAGGSASIVIEKTPDHVFHIEYIKTLLPRAIIIGIVRDPRNTYVSWNEMLSLQKKNKRSVAEFTSLWNEATRSIATMSSSYLTYEELIQNPKQSVNSILVEYEMEIISDKLTQESYESITRPSEVWKGNAASDVSSYKQRPYENILRSAEIAEIDAKCGIWMDYFGYARSNRCRRSYVFTAVDRMRHYRAIVASRISRKSIPKLRR